MICGNCGFQNEPGDEFCGSCGKFLEWEGTTEPTPEPIPQPLPPEPPPPEPIPQPQPPPPPPEPIPVNQLVRCSVCGTANEPTRSFCRNCGTKLTRSGVRYGGGGGFAAGGGDGGINWLLVGGGAALVTLLLLAIGVAYFGGFLGGPGTSVASTTPTPTGPVAVGTSPPPESQPPSGAPTTPPDTAGPSSPVETQSPSTPTDSPALPTESPGQPTQAPTSSPAGFSCDPQRLSAAAPGGWRVEAANFGRRARLDYLAFEMAPFGTSDAAASTDAFLVPAAEVPARFGVPGPTTGDIALVLAFNDAVGLTGPFGAQPNYRALEEFRISRNGSRQVIAVLGVTGQGCFSLSSDGWASGASGPAELVVSIAR